MHLTRPAPPRAVARPAAARSSVAGPTVVAGCLPADTATDSFEARWSYTVGWCHDGSTELVVVGLAGRVARQLVAQVRASDAWADLPIGAPVRLGGVHVVLRDVPSTWLASDPSRMSSWMVRFGGRSAGPEVPRVIQLVWGDGRGRFPGDSACDPLVAEDQPLLAAGPFGFPQVRSHAARPELPWSA